MTDVQAENTVPDVNGQPPHAEEEEEDPYAVSSDSDEESDTKPPPVINIGDRSTGIGELEKYSKFKDKFEHIEQEIAKSEEEKKKNSPDVEIDREKLSAAKDRFEKPPIEPTEPVKREVIEVNRSEAEKRRVQKTFNQAKEEEPKDCAVCKKMVYPVEKLNAEGRVYHKSCFKCSKCSKTLCTSSYYSHNKQLLCKLHMLELFHPEMFQNLDPNTLEDIDVEEPDEEEEYAKVSKPKMLRADVVRSGLKSADDLENIRSLQSAKSQLASSAAEAEQKSENKSYKLDAEMFEKGKVKSRLTKFAEAGEESSEDSEREEDVAEEGRDPNIVRSTKKTKKDYLNLEVGKIKGKWETGEVETAGTEKTDRSWELDEIKKGVKVKERFKEKTGAEPDEEAPHRRSVLEEENLDTTFTSAAKERFLKGEAYQDSAPIERTAKDEIHFKELGSFKEKFERGDIEEASHLSKTQVDARCEELKSIKDAFEKAKGIIYKLRDTCSQVSGHVGGLSID